MLTLLHQPAVVWHDLALREVQSHLQGNQYWELQRNQLPPVYTETLLQLLLIQGEKSRGFRLRMLVNTEIGPCVIHFISATVCADVTH